ncbi:LLM class flavin-dependent oxidoreductase [Rufibacter glacialis]|uniref:Luciferase-like monooxygenase n=1 Tax=Rufibacter glacialis TaxID=1259555 RepID=A0A5M8QLE4_9BACT|nr:LLM class flavin-dependent oxidoreductase [Rufibacter glacialis]KAA6435790.1 LLM class flavin-dependent oxidoreductase [Rufibacter glacialis]GGK66580.1 alkane 1-monooxygenase [Rufibacter glacialis]
MSTKKLSDIPVSVLDLVPILQGQTAAASFQHTIDLAQRVDQMGFKRYWMAEHHNMAGIASSATVVLIGHVAGATSRIRVGSGGIMLPNHAPLVVAEQFGTLATLYPGRIDLGLGRAPGTDQVTAMALRRDLRGSVDEFPQNVVEVKNYLGPVDPTARVRAVPGEGSQVPIWILGSSTFGAQLAGILGMPYAFASHFAPSQLQAALKVYRESFQPVGDLKEPYAMACVNVIAADTDEEAIHQSTSLYQSFLNVVRGTAKPMQPPVESMDGLWDAQERYAVQQMLRYSFIGGPKTVQEELQAFLDETGVDEIMVGSNIYDHAGRVHSYEIISRFFQPSKD